MKILFLCSGGGACRSLIAKAVMQSFDENLEVYAAGIDELTCQENQLLNIIAKAGYNIEQARQYLVSDVEKIEFDYLITLCEGTKEEFYKLPLNYKQKLHLGFTDPENLTGKLNDKETVYKELIEEINDELNYFYHHILKKALSN